MSTLRVDKISPFQSSSILIEGNVIQANAATTGSNTFVGNQEIQGALTASLQQGYAWVGGVGGVSTLVATSSFIEAPIQTGSFATTQSLNSYTQSNDSKVNTLVSATGSFATTG